MLSALGNCLERFLLKLDYLALKVSSYPSKSTVLIRCEGELTENVPTLLCNSRKKCRRFTSNFVQISLKDLTFPEQPKTKTAREHRPLSQKRQQTAFETSIMDQSQAVKSKVNGLLQEPMANIFKAIGNWKVEKLVAGKKKSSKKYGSLTELSKEISYSKGDHYTYTVSFDLT